MFSDYMNSFKSNIGTIGVVDDR